MSVVQVPLAQSKEPEAQATIRYLVVFNPVQSAKRQKLLALLISELKNRSLNYTLYPTEANLTANKHYFKSHLQQYTDVVVLGGDGTFNVVVNCIVDAQLTQKLNQKLSHKVNVGLLPAGTGNDFSKQWFNKANVKKAKQKGHSQQDLINIVLGNQVQTLYLGECHYDNKIRYFNNVLGVGFDAVIAKQLAHQKSLFRSLSYIVAALRHIPFYQEPKCELVLKGKTTKYRNLITAFANSQYFGGGLPIAPNQDGRTESLTVIRAPKLSVIPKVMLLLKLTKGRHLSSKGVVHNQMQKEEEAEITTAGLEIEADGEYIGETPCKVKVSSHTINLKV